MNLQKLEVGTALWQLYETIYPSLFNRTENHEKSSPWKAHDNISSRFFSAFREMKYVFFKDSKPRLVGWNWFQSRVLLLVLLNSWLYVVFVYFVELAKHFIRVQEWRKRGEKITEEKETHTKA